MRKRLPPHAVGDATIAVLAEQRRKGWPGDLVTWGDLGTLDAVGRRSGFYDLHPWLHVLDAHIRLLNALEQDTRFEKFLFRCVDSNGVRERWVRAFRLRTL